MPSLGFLSRQIPNKNHAIEVTGPGCSASCIYLGPLLHTSQGLFEAGSVEPYHHLFTDDDYWNAERSGYLDHLLKGLSILTDIMLSKGDPLLRKELFRRGAVGSGGGRIDRYFLYCSLLSREVTASNLLLLLRPEGLGVRANKVLEGLRLPASDILHHIRHSGKKPVFMVLCHVAQVLD